MATSLFTSESVSMGHPDKLCDQISDAVLDAVLDMDSEISLPARRVACEALVSKGLIVLAGELSPLREPDFYEKLARDVVREVGYTSAERGMDADRCQVHISLSPQSSDISQGVKADDGTEQGAGDQGMMFGFACDETEALMPAPILYAHRLMERHRECFEKGEISYLRPDAKSQVTFEYDESWKPLRVSAVVLSTQHDDGVSHSEIEKDVKEKIILPVLGNLAPENPRGYHINPTVERGPDGLPVPGAKSAFVTGGPEADAGLTGRKIIVDTYGGMGRHGGGAFSGKDPSKVDRSAAYAARWVAKNLVAAGLARRCEVQIAYAIGVAEPVSVRVDSFGTSQHGDAKLAELVRDCFDLRPRTIIEELGLLRREHNGAKWRYRDTACYGHFGREGFPWEDTGKAAELRRRAGR